MTVSKGFSTALRASTALVAARFLSLSAPALFPAMLLALGAAVSPAMAQPIWQGPGMDFNTGTNWSTGTVPTTAQAAVFANTGPTSLFTSLNTQLAGITFNAGAAGYNLTLGNDMTLTGSVVNSSVNQQTISVASGTTLFFQGTAGSGQGVNYTGSGTVVFDDDSTGGNSAFNVGSQIGIRGNARTVALGSLSGAPGTLIRNFTASDITLQVGSLGTSTSFGGAFGSIAGAGALTLEKVGTGTLTLTGTSTHTATLISAGTLQLGTGGSLGTGAVTNNAALVFNSSSDMTVGNLISGTGSVTQAGSGRTILTADNTYSGTTTISAGTLQIGNGGATGSLGTSGVVNNGVLAFNRSAAADIDNVISGSGSVSVTGTGRIRFNASNTYGGGTVVTNGTVEVAADAGLGLASGGLTLDGGALITAGSFASGRAVVLNSGGGGIEAGTGTALTLNGVISGTGTLSLNGSGTVVLGAVNTYTGDTIVNGGVLSVAADSGLGSTAGTLFLNGGGLTTTATFSTARSIVLQSDTDFRPAGGTTLTVAGTVTGGSGLAMSGAGTLVLTGTNSYGTTTINSGTLQVGDGVNTGTLGSGGVVNNAALVFNNPGTSLVAGEISGTGTLTQAGTGTTVLQADNSYTGLTTITAGTLQVGNNGTTGTLGTANVVNDGALVFARSDGLTVNNLISGTGSVAQNGGGTLTLAADNTYSGGTFLNAGVLQVSSNARLGALSGGLTFAGGTLATTASFTSARSITLNTGNGSFAPAAGTTLALTGPISGAGGLIMNGAGRLELSAGNTYQLGTGIVSGVLAISADSALGDAAGVLQMTGGALVTTADISMTRSVGLLNATAALRPDTGTTLTLSGAISDLGPPAGFVMDGAGTLVLTGTNTYSGTTTISSGTLRVGAGGATGTLGSGDVVNNAALVFNRTGALTVPGAISGTGTVTQAGTGTTVLTGDNSYSGTTTISAGTLQIGDGGSNGTLGSGNVVNNGTLAFNRDFFAVSNPISGTGQVRQIGTGITYLTGPLSHTGGTFVDQGFLILGDTGLPVILPGDATVAADGTLFLFNGSLGGGVVTNNGSLGVLGTSTAGSATINNSDSLTGGLYFGDTASAGTSTITNLGTLEFSGDSTAASSTIYNSCCLAFTDRATAANATVVNYATGNIDFAGSASAGASSITNAGYVRFMDTASGGTASYVGQAGSTVDFSYMTASGTTLGSLAGTGAVNLGRITLTVGGNGTSTTFAGVIADGGLIGGTGAGLTKVGAGTLILSGANTYTGTTTISAGTLRIGAGGITGTLGTGPVVNNATLAFNRSNAMTVANAISGAGAVQQVGSGTVILTGANTYSGTTTIGEGSLQVGAGGTTGSLGTGNVVNGGALAFNRSNTMTVANAISGAGSLTQAGTGNLILTGTSSYTGATFVNAGRLSVNGSIASSSGVTVASGGTLGGTGSLPGVSVLSGGTLAPGNSIGTLSVAGNLTLAPGSTTQIEVQGLLIDRINVSGTAALGGTLQLLAQGGAYTFNAPYTIVQAGAVTGNFAAVSSTGSFGAGVTSNVSTSTNQAQLTLTPAPLVPIVTPPVVIPPVVTPPVEPPPVVKSAPVIGPRGTPNQISVAAGFDRALAGGADVSAYFPLYNLPAATLPRGLDLVSGQIHAVAMGMHAQPAYQFLGATLDPGRGRQALGDGADGSAPRYAVWASGFGGGGRMGASGNPGTYAATASGGGVAVGADVRLSAQVVAGMALAGSGATTRLADSMGRAETSQIQGAIYGTGSFGALRLSAAVAYGGMDVTTRRTVPFLGVGDIRGRYTSSGVSTRIEAGWRMEHVVPRVVLTPSLAFQGSWYDTPSFTETAAGGQSAAALAVSGRNQGQSRMELSLRADMAVTPTLLGFGRIGWAAYLQRDAGMTARFIGLANSGFSLGGARPDANAALLSGGVDWRLNPTMTVTARVDAELASNSYAVNGTARIRYEF
jgi:fibronectin-binding autotransporter adhesin